MLIQGVRKKILHYFVLDYLLLQAIALHSENLLIVDFIVVSLVLIRTLGYVRDVCTIFSVPIFCTKMQPPTLNVIWCWALEITP